MIDPVLSFLVAGLILRSTWCLIRDSGHILLEGTPVELDVREIGSDLVEHLDAIEDVHHVHAWSLAQGRALLTLTLGSGKESIPTPPSTPSIAVSRSAST